MVVFERKDVSDVLQDICKELQSMCESLERTDKVLSGILENQRKQYESSE